MIYRLGNTIYAFEGDIPMQKLRRQKLQELRRGAIIVYAAVSLFLLLAMAVFAIDVAYMQLVRTELRTSTDAATSAASEALARTQSVAAARQAARRAAAANPVAREPLQLADADIVFGVSEQNGGQGRFQFRPVNISDADPNPIDRVNSVQVDGRRTEGSASGSVNLLMGSLLGTETFQPTVQTTSTAVVRDIALVLDRSGSMRTNDKIGDLKDAVELFLQLMEDSPNEERISLSTYSTTGTKDIDLTSNMNAVANVVEQMPAEGFTAIGEGLEFGSDSLVNDAQARRFAEKTIILLTDGRENRGIDAIDVVPVAQQRNQTVFTITFGADADQTLMRQVATQTGGFHQHADDGGDLEEAFRTIAETLAVVLVQ